MNVATLILTNGRRDCIARTIPSLRESVTPLGPLLVADDSGDPDYVRWLDRFGPDRMLVPLPSAGYAVAMWRALGWVAASEFDWVFVVEDDFVFHRPVDLEAMAAVMDADPRIAQMVLLRQPWYPSEKRSGGVLERFDPAALTRHDGWTEHRLFWSMNPHLVRRSFLAEHRWPLGDRSERRFGQAVFRDPETVVGMWGTEPWVEHIGTERVGTGY